MIYIWCSKYHMFTTSLQNYAGDKPKLYKIMITKIFVILGKAKLNTENTKDSNLAAGRLTIALMFKPPKHDLLYRTWTDECLGINYIHIFMCMCTYV